jgi:hypothetical protein
MCKTLKFIFIEIFCEIVTGVPYGTLVLREPVLIILRPTYIERYFCKFIFRNFHFLLFRSTSDESWTQAARWRPADRLQASWRQFYKSTPEALSSNYDQLIDTRPAGASSINPHQRSCHRIRPADRHQASWCQFYKSTPEALSSLPSTLVFLSYYYVAFQIGEYLLKNGSGRGEEGSSSQQKSWAKTIPRKRRCFALQV